MLRSSNSLLFSRVGKTPITDHQRNCIVISEFSSLGLKFAWVWIALSLEKIVGKKPAVVVKYKLAYIPLKTIMNFDDVMKNVIFPFQILWLMNKLESHACVIFGKGFIAVYPSEKLLEGEEVTSYIFVHMYVFYVMPSFYIDRQIHWPIIDW